MDLDTFNLAFGLGLGLIALVLIAGVRFGYLKSWQSTLLMTAFSGAGGAYYGISVGGQLVGATCMATILILAFGLPMFFIHAL